MVAEFADPLFDNVATLAAGRHRGTRQVGLRLARHPVPGLRAPLAERRTQPTRPLAAPDADFAADRARAVRWRRGRGRRRPGLARSGESAAEATEAIERARSPRAHASPSHSRTAITSTSSSTSRPSARPGAARDRRATAFDDWYRAHPGRARSGRITRTTRCSRAHDRAPPDRHVVVPVVAGPARASEPRRLHLVHGPLRVGQVDDRGRARAPPPGARPRGHRARR